MSELDPQIAAELALQLAAPGSEDPAGVRADYEAATARLSGPPVEVAHVEDRPGPPAVRIYTPADAHGTIVYLHGGGWVVGSIATHDHVARRLANASGARVALVDYRLGPEDPYPAAVEDAHAALALARELGGPIAVAGDSAGGNLAAVLARHHPSDIAYQALIYPVTDAGLAGESYDAFGDGRFGLSQEGMAWYLGLYGATDPDDPDVSPLRAPDLSGQPPAHVVLASHDVLRSEGEAYAARLREAGVPTTIAVYEGTVHGFLRWTAVTDVAGRAIEEIGAAIRVGLRTH